MGEVIHLSKEDPELTLEQIIKKRELTSKGWVFRKVTIVGDVLMVDFSWEKAIFIEPDGTMSPYDIE